MGLTDFSAKITDIDSKIPTISGLATTSALTTVANKIPDVSGLVRKTDYNTKSSEIEKKVVDHNHDKYITTPEFNKFNLEVSEGRLAWSNLVTKTDFDTKLISLNRKNNSNKTKHVLVENELKKLQTFDSIYFRSKSHFEENATQNYLVFQPMYRYFKRVSGVGKGNHIYFWKSKGLSDENITLPATIDYSITPKLGYFGTKT